MTSQTFEAFGFAEPLARALTQREYTTPTPIQVQALPPQLEGRDLMALAETGSGKTAAFLLPILQRIAKNPVELNWKQVSALILAPTRELALQIDQEVASLARNMQIRRAVVLGGVSKGPQINALKRGVHILVATPGRLLDHVNMRSCDLSGVQTLVLDEADRMFDMGFIRDIKKIAGMTPHKRRTAMFSATMPAEIRTLAKEMLNDPAFIDLSTKQKVVDRVDQKVMIVRSAEKQSRLHTILKDEACSRVIIFTRTKRGADRVTERLASASIDATAIHGNKAQNARQRALADFSQGHVRVLVATDIAARGIDVTGISHVINFDMPLEAETYVHRIGRTARNGNAGIAISLCDPAEKSLIVSIEKLMKQKIEVMGDIGGETLPMPEKRPHHSADAPRREGAHRKGPSPRSFGGEGRGDRGGERRDGRSSFRSDDSKAMPAALREGGEGFNPARADSVMPQRDAADARPAFKPRQDRHQDGPRAARKPERAEAPRAHKPFNRDGTREGSRDAADRRDRPPSNGHRSNAPRSHAGPEGKHERPRAERPRSERPRTERPHSERPSSDAPRGDPPNADARGPRREWQRDGDKPRNANPRNDGQRNDGPRKDGPRKDVPHGNGKPAHANGPSRPHRDGAKPAAASRSEGSWKGQQPPKFLKRREDGATGRPNRKPAA